LATPTSTTLSSALCEEFIPDYSLRKKEVYTINPSSNKTIRFADFLAYNSAEPSIYVFKNKLFDNLYNSTTASIILESGQNYYIIAYHSGS